VVVEVALILVLLDLIVKEILEDQVVVIVLVLPTVLQLVT
jgi:hypothetical protein